MSPHVVSLNSIERNKRGSKQTGKGWIQEGINILTDQPNSTYVSNPIPHVFHVKYKYFLKSNDVRIKITVKKTEKIRVE